MQMNFENTPIGNAKVGDTLYIVCYDEGTGVWYSKVSFDSLSVKVTQDKWGHSWYFDVDYYTLILKYLNEKNKEKEIKVKWSYSKKSKPEYKKSKNFNFFKNAKVTCTSIPSSDNWGIKVYISDSEEKMKEFIEKEKIFENALLLFEKKKRDTVSYIDEQIERIKNYNI